MKVEDAIALSMAQQRRLNQLKSGMPEPFIITSSSVIVKPACFYAIHALQYSLSVNLDILELLLHTVN